MHRPSKVDTYCVVCLHRRIMYSPRSSHRLRRLASATRCPRHEDTSASRELYWARPEVSLPCLLRQDDMYNLPALSSSPYTMHAQTQSPPARSSASSPKLGDCNSRPQDTSLPVPFMSSPSSPQRPRSRPRYVLLCSQSSAGVFLMSQHDFQSISGIPRRHAPP